MLLLPSNPAPASPPPPPCSPAPGNLLSQSREELQNSERGRTAPGQWPNTVLEAGKTHLLLPSHISRWGGEEGTELPRSQRRVGCGGIIPAPATGADVTANYSIPRPSPPPKLYLREGKNNSWRGRSWNEPKDSSSIPKTRTNQGRNPLPATRGRGLSPIWGSGHSPLGAGASALRAAAVPGHLHPGSGVAAGTGGGNRSRAALVLPPRCEPALALPASCLSRARQVNGPSR